jgi:hypothetical protein
MRCSYYTSVQLALCLIIDLIPVFLVPCQRQKGLYHQGLTDIGPTLIHLSDNEALV